MTLAATTHTRILGIRTIGLTGELNEVVGVNKANSTY